MPRNVFWIREPGVAVLHACYNFNDFLNRHVFWTACRRVVEGHDPKTGDEQRCELCVALLPTDVEDL
jgi:hypothetical protein